MWGDWRQLWEIVSLPDNIPIVAMLFLVPFYMWYAFRQAFATDKLIDQLAGDAALAKTHHRKVYPWKKGWDREVHVWPYLMRIEFLAAIIVTVILTIWSITLNAPLEEPANPNLTMNPAKAPWYFLGLQEMLVYFDPWIAGVVMPTLIIVGLMAIPYIDVNPLGNGYYTYKQRKFAIWTFLFGFIGLWVVMIVVGTFIRGPGWMWFWPTQTWDHTRVDFDVNRNLNQVLPFSLLVPDNFWGRLIFGTIAIAIFFVVAGYLAHRLCVATDFAKRMYRRMTLLQVITLHTLLILMLSLPVKILFRLLFRIKYVLVTPWFSI
jgi:hypothetical protein